MQNKLISLCLIGFGNAGQEFCRLLLEKEAEILENYGCDVIVAAIATKSKGVLVNGRGIDLPRALAEAGTQGSFAGDNPDRRDFTTMEAIRRSNADILIELSPLSIKDGQPAISHIEEAFRQGMHVITANKGPIAWDYKRLKEVADSKNLCLLHETTVMDGTPIFNLVKYTLPGCKILGFKGILNTTTNFILEEMEKGKCYEDAVREAQSRGFAEADPSMDVDGWDAAVKTNVLMNVLMGEELTPMDIQRKGIGEITLSDIEAAQKSGKKIKLLCEGLREDGKAIGRVYPTLLDDNDVFAKIEGTSSVLSINTDLMGELCIIERNPEIQQTAYGIYSDLLTVLKCCEKGCPT